MIGARAVRVIVVSSAPATRRKAAQNTSGATQEDCNRYTTPCGHPSQIPLPTRISPSSITSTFLNCLWHSIVHMHPTFDPAGLHLDLRCRDWARCLMNTLNPSRASGQVQRLTKVGPCWAQGSTAYLMSRRTATIRVRNSRNGFTSVYFESWDARTMGKPINRSRPAPYISLIERRRGRPGECESGPLHVAYVRVRLTVDMPPIMLRSNEIGSDWANRTRRSSRHQS
ncbi:hypothetical protein C8Q80DRAFT_870811 [Daedaleopsis nitida]|nr:hypothetical protein C8Q80DRAFT_870811 [Daedaleopsis nitida]